MLETAGAEVALDNVETVELEPYDRISTIKVKVVEDRDGTCFAGLKLEDGELNELCDITFGDDGGNGRWREYELPEEVVIVGFAVDNISSDERLGKLAFLTATRENASDEPEKTVNTLQETLVFGMEDPAGEETRFPEDDSALAKLSQPTKLTTIKYSCQGDDGPLDSIQLLF